jgi:hypothetical protein
MLSHYGTPGIHRAQAYRLVFQRLLARPSSAPQSTAPEVAAESNS